MATKKPGTRVYRRYSTSALLGPVRDLGIDRVAIATQETRNTYRLRGRERPESVEKEQYPRAGTESYEWTADFSTARTWALAALTKEMDALDERRKKRAAEQLADDARTAQLRSRKVQWSKADESTPLDKLLDMDSRDVRAGLEKYPLGEG